jgi:hypothetical protein
LDRRGNALAARLCFVGLIHLAGVFKNLSGQLNEHVLIAALQRSGLQLDTEKLVSTLENLRDLDIGLGTPVTFSRSDHQGRLLT